MRCHHLVRSRIWLALVALLLAACSSGPTSGATPPGVGRPSESITNSAPKVLVAGMGTDVRAFNQRVARATSSGPLRGGPELEWLLNGGLTKVDERGNTIPELAEAAPTVENGRWKIFPDGRMETSWTIRDGAQWHDGTPFTTADLLFTAAVVRDPELGAFGESVYDLIEGIEAPDARTLLVRWKVTTIEADQMFTQRFAVPMPRHLLEPTYLEGKAKLFESPYWLGGFVGTGPYKLRTWTQGSGVLLQANENYVLGKPKIDTIEVKYITDPNTLISNLLAGAVDLTLGYGVSLESALLLKAQWADGRVEMAPNGWIPIHPQFMNPRPAAVADLRFRQAMLRGLDRQEMVETLQAGLVQVAHGFLDPSDPDYPAVERNLVRYDYDPARAAQGLADLGYSRAGDGWVDASGPPLEVELRTVEGLDIQVKATLAVADAWQRLGVRVQQVVVSATGTPQDRENNANFPAFRLIRQPNTTTDMNRYLISQTPTAETRFTGFNFTRYQNPAYHELILRYFQTIPRTERTEVLGQILRHQSEQLVIMGLFYNVQSVGIGKRVQNVTNSGALGFNQAWNANLWELAS
jgi:peptide/nickel transport system substrate-binding protein